MNEVVLKGTDGVLRFVGGDMVVPTEREIADCSCAQITSIFRIKNNKKWKDIEIYLTWAVGSEKVNIEQRVK